MPETDILILASFDRYNRLSEDDIIAVSGCTEQSLETLVRSGILIRDTGQQQGPRIFYRLTFFGTLAAADAKRRKIREDRRLDSGAMFFAKGTARTGFPTPTSGQPSSSLETKWKHSDGSGPSHAERMRRKTLAEDIARLHPDLALPKTRRGWKR